MPNGVTAPGNVSPPLLVPINVLTRLAGSLTAALAEPVPVTAMASVTPRAVRPDIIRWREPRESPCRRM
jgi:hypothetical protein